MVLRLSIAMALSGHPSIVLIDDVLSVGDIAFRQKCVERLHALKDANCTLIVVLNDEALVQQLATRVVTLTGGRVVSDTPLHSEGSATYGSSAADVEWRTAEDFPEDDVVALRAVIS